MTKPTPYRSIKEGNDASGNRRGPWRIQAERDVWRSRCVTPGSRSWTLVQTNSIPAMTTPISSSPWRGRSPREKVERGVALCGSGVGATIAANKVPGVRAGLINHVFCAHQGVEDDDMNVCCLGGKVVGAALAWELVQTFLAAHFSGAPRHARRVAKVQALENRKDGPLKAHSKRLNRFARTARHH